MKRMQISLIVLLSFLCTQFGTAATAYQPGDSMYVWAKSGLKMRVEPNLKGDKMLTIPYGTKVHIDSYQEELPEVKIRVVEAQNIKGTAYKSFYLKGHWCRVTYLDTIGYIFDGYLSKMPTFNLDPYLNQAEIKYTVKETFEDYADKHFGSLQQLSFENKPSYITPLSSRKIYGNGMLIEEGFTESTWKKKLILPGMSFEEGFLLFSLRYDFEENTKPLGEDIYPVFRITKKGTKFVKIEGGNEDIWIQEIDGIVVISITEYAGC